MKVFERIKNLIYSLLKKSERYTNTDMIYLAKGGFWLTLGQIISTAASFLLAMAFANLLDPITYGNYKYILSLVGILSIFTLTGMGTAVTQAVAQGLEGSFYTGFKTKFKWGLLGSLVAIGGAIYYWIRGNYLLPIPLLISAIFLPLMLASQTYASFLVGKKLFNIQVKYDAFSQIISAGILIVTLFFTKNLFWLVAIYFVSHTFLNYFFYLLTKSKFKPNIREDPQTPSYGKHLSLIQIISAVATHLDKILLFTLIGSAQLAIYSFALILPEMLRGLMKKIVPLSLPKFAQRNIQEIKQGFFKKIMFAVLFASLIIGFYILIAPLVFRVFFPLYQESIKYSQMLSLIILGAIPGLMGSVFLAHKAKKEIVTGTTILPIFQIGATLLLGYCLGFIGIIFARIITSFFHIFLMTFLFLQFLKKNS